MEDDITFGASIWSSSEPISLLSPQEARIASPETDIHDTYESQFDDFDGFGGSQETKQDAGDDDFGDFGDFEETKIVTPIGDDGFEDQISFADPSTQQWFPLRLDPMPLGKQLEERVSELLAPTCRGKDLSAVTTEEAIREVEGISQILTSAESRDLCNKLLKSPPPTKPPNWTRSRIRRQHLIALGIPVNLDEILPNVNGKPLPPLQIITRSMSTPPGPRNPPYLNNPSFGTSTPRVGTPQPTTGRIAASPFGPKPELDENKINQLLDLTLDTLTLQPLSMLERYLADLKTQTANTSALLTHLLQIRDSLQQDAETYNKLIAELVGEAQRIKTGKGRVVPRRGSGMS